MPPPFDLILVTDGGPELIARVRRAISGATPARIAVQLRDKQRGAGELIDIAFELRTLTREVGAALLINDRVDVALAVGADGVHLPEAGLTPGMARKLLGPHAWVGASRHDLKGLFEAAREGADYATLSPIHAVAGKAAPLGIAGFGRIIAGVRMPVYALGGVQAKDVADLCSAGARGVAVIREVLQAHDPAQAVSTLLSHLDKAWPPKDQAGSLAPSKVAG